MRNENGNGYPDGSRTTISSESRVTLRFVWAVIAILTPVVSMLFMLYESQQTLRTKMDAVGTSVQSLQVTVGDRWTRSMMVLYSTELELRNRAGGYSSNLHVPNPEEIARRIPSLYAP